jgi:hypothetical protein
MKNTASAHRPITLNDDAGITAAYSWSVLDKLASEPQQDTQHRFDHAELPDPAQAFAEDLQEKISRRAYEFAESRNFAPGHDVEDWLRAEREVLMAPDLQKLHIRT